MKVYFSCRRADELHLRVKSSLAEGLVSNPPHVKCHSFFPGHLYDNFEEFLEQIYEIAYLTETLFANGIINTFTRS